MVAATLDLCLDADMLTPSSLVIVQRTASTGGLRVPTQFFGDPQGRSARCTNPF
jgi:hypothetical protein